MQDGNGEVYNAGQKNCNKVKTSSEIGQEQKTLVTASA